MNCDCICRNDYCVCSRCQARCSPEVHQECSKPGPTLAEQMARAQPGSPKGPGTHLHELFQNMGIRHTSSCDCWENAQKMDQLGVGWCENNIEEIVGWIREAASKRTLINFLYSDWLARYVVKLAISKAKADLTAQIK